MRKRKGILKKCIFSLFVASIFMACDKQVVYHTFHTMPIQGWQAKDTLIFSTQLPDSNRLYHIFVEVRNRNNYPYQDLPILLYCNNAANQIIQSDTLELTLASKEGVWLGNGWGGLYQSASSAVTFHSQQAGELSFKIVHLLRDEYLPGIHDVGIKITY